MIEINLLPVRSRKKRKAASDGRHFFGLYVLGVFLLIAAIGFLWVTKSNEIGILQAKSNKLKNEMKKYERFEKELADLKKEQDSIVKRRNVIQDLKKDRDKIVRLLALLGAEVPGDRLWFERFALSGAMLTLNGIALTNETVAEFMKGLEDSPYVEKGTVSLTHSRQTVIRDTKLREFQISFRFLPYSAVEKKLKKDSGAPAAPVAPAAS